MHLMPMKNSTLELSKMTLLANSKRNHNPERKLLPWMVRVKLATTTRKKLIEMKNLVEMKG